jgi:formylglycine-generating enzyme required for sulfatase activity
VTNGHFLEFVEQDGYDDPRLWTKGGWAWRQAEAALRFIGNDRATA